MAEEIYVKVCNGKYTVVLSDEPPLTSFLRYGQPWEAANEDWRHAKFISTMARELHEDRTLLHKLFKAALPFDAPVPGKGSIDEYENFRAIMKEVRNHIKEELFSNDNHS